VDDHTKSVTRVFNFEGEIQPGNILQPFAERLALPNLESKQMNVNPRLGLCHFSMLKGPRNFLDTSEHSKDYRVVLGKFL
jgi:hypothetical protein